MPRIRTVKPEFWKSESIAALPFRARLTFIGLWTYVDDNGVGLDNFKLISAELFGLEDDPREARANVREDLARLHAAGRIVRYMVAGKRYLAIVNWDEHQKIDRPGRSRHPSRDNEDSVWLSREDAWAMDGPGGAPAPDSRDSREGLAPGAGNRGTGNREQGTGDSAKADTADAVSSAQGAFAGMPTPPPNLPATRQPKDDKVAVDANAQQVVRAYVDGATAANLEKPAGTLCGRVGREAKKLLGEGKDIAKLIGAAYEMGGSEYNDLAVAYRKHDAAQNGRSRTNLQGRGGSELSRRSTSAVRAEQALSVADELDRLNGHGRYAQEGTR
jgi:hypothetical protein